MNYFLLCVFYIYEPRFFTMLFNTQLLKFNFKIGKKLCIDKFNFIISMNDKSTTSLMVQKTSDDLLVILIYNAWRYNRVYISCQISYNISISNTIA